MCIHEFQLLVAVFNNREKSQISVGTLLSHCAVSDLEHLTRCRVSVRIIRPIIVFVLPPTIVCYC